MAPIGQSHESIVGSLNRALVLACLDRAIVWPQNSLRLDYLNVPQPDFALLRPRDDFYATGERPRPGDVFVLIEVADSSLHFRYQGQAAALCKGGHRGTMDRRCEAPCPRCLSQARGGRLCRADHASCWRTSCLGFRAGDRRPAPDDIWPVKLLQIVGRDALWHPTTVHMAGGMPASHPTGSWTPTEPALSQTALSSRPDGMLCEATGPHTQYRVPTIVGERVACRRADKRSVIRQMVRLVVDGAALIHPTAWSTLH